MEVPRLDQDERFSDKPYVKQDNGFRYYLGIPLKVGTGENIGALCVLDQEKKTISENGKRLLQLIADEIVKKMEAKLELEALHEELRKVKTQRNQLAHDLRGQWEESFPLPLALKM